MHVWKGSNRDWPKSSCEETGGDFAAGGHYTVRRVLAAATALPTSKAPKHSVSRAQEAFYLALGPGEIPFHGLALHVAHGHLGHNALHEDLRCDLGRRGCARNRQYLVVVQVGIVVKGALR